jgi:hypothetical protein
LEFSQPWTSDTARNDALVRKDGIWVKSADNTRRYLGTFRTISTTQTTDTAAQRYLWNMYNQAPRPCLVTKTTANWTYAPGNNTYRQAGADSAAKFEYVCGDPVTMTRLIAGVSVIAGNTGANLPPLSASASTRRP